MGVPAEKSATMRRMVPNVSDAGLIERRDLRGSLRSLIGYGRRYRLRGPTCRQMSLLVPTARTGRAGKLLLDDSHERLQRLGP